jgi:hypothetical protein
MLTTLLIASTLAGEPIGYEEWIERSSVELKYPDPATATILSAHIGFGAGHFYSRRPVAGLTHLTLQGGGLAGVVYGVTEVVHGFENSVQVQSPADLVPANLTELKGWESDLDQIVTPDHDRITLGLTYVGSGFYILLVRP